MDEAVDLPSMEEQRSLSHLSGGNAAYVEDLATKNGITKKMFRYSFAAMLRMSKIYTKTTYGIQMGCHLSGETTSTVCQKLIVKPRAFAISHTLCSAPNLRESARCACALKLPERKIRKPLNTNESRFVSFS